MNQTKRIVAIEPSGNLYGSEYCLLDILQHTDRNRFAWSVITTAGPFCELLRRSESEIPTYPALTPGLHLKSRFSKVPSYLRLFRLLWTTRPSLLYVNQSGILRITHTIANILRIPIVCQVQTLEDAESLAGSKKLPMVQCFICNSEFIAAKIRVDSSRVAVLYQGIKPDSQGETNRLHFSAPELPLNGILRLGILGRIGKSKGHYLLADAVKKLSCRATNFSVRVIGDGISPAATQDWINYLNALQIRQFFDLRGYQSNIRKELSDVDLLLIPSLAEPLGRVLFDAAIHQIPVVVSDAGGLGEISSRFEVGVPFSSGNPESLVEAILRFRDSYEPEKKRFIANSRRMLTSLSMQSYIDCIDSILVNSIQRRPTSLTWFGDQ